MSAMHDTSYPQESLDRMQMLFWRLDLIKRTFANLNECSIGVLGRENYRFFKDREYRLKMLFADDRVLLDQAMASFRDRMPVRLVFRVDCDDTIYWYKLTGWPTEDHRYYEGTVEDVSEHIAWLRNVFDQQNQRLMDVDSETYPVAIFSDGGGQLVKANTAFCRLLKLSRESMTEKALSDLVAPEFDWAAVFEQLLTGRSLSKEISFKVSPRQTVVVYSRMEFFFETGRGYIRLAVMEKREQRRLVSRRKTADGAKKVLKEVCTDLAQCQSINAMLNRVYQAKDLFPGMDVVMFSDIYARKNKVIVYASGEMSEPLEQGSQFPYAGTIAENIEKEDLEYLIVEDTQSSIKAIDWMLFVPKGLYSYVAKALYVRGAMRTVLILCSKQKNSFNESQVGDVEEIAKAFHQQLKKIRRMKK